MLSANIERALANSYSLTISRANCETQLYRFEFTQIETGNQLCFYASTLQEADQMTMSAIAAGAFRS